MKDGNKVVWEVSAPGHTKAIDILQRNGGYLCGLPKGLVHSEGYRPFRITIEELPLPEPEPRTWCWQAEWSVDEGFKVSHWPSLRSEGDIAVDWRDGHLRSVATFFHSADEPTFEQFREAVKDATGVEIPVPEQPEPDQLQWWAFTQGSGWSATDYESVSVTFDASGSLRHACIPATTATRDDLLKALVRVVWPVVNAGKQP